MTQSTHNCIHTHTGSRSQAAQHERQCTALSRMDSCMRNYTTHCTTPLQEHLVNMGLSGVRRIQQEYCSPGSELRQTYLKHVPCLRSVLKNPANPCMKDLNVMGEVVTEAKWNKRVNYACCGYHRIGSCLRREVTRACGPETMDFVRTMAKKLMSRLPEIRCRDLTEDSPVCSELPPFGSNPKGGRSTSVVNKLIRTYTGN